MEIFKDDRYEELAEKLTLLACQNLEYLIDNLEDLKSKS